jgi:hypothetical protein
MRPHTGTYCSVQTVGRRAPSSFGESCAVTAPLTKYEARAGIVESADAGTTRAASMAMRAMIMANTPNVPGEICLVAGAFSVPMESERRALSLQPYFFLGGAAGGEVTVVVETGAEGGVGGGGGRVSPC